MNANKSSKRNMQPAQRLLLLISLALTGCASQQSAQPIDVEPQQLCLGNIDKANAMHAAQEVLLDMHFDIDKADPKTGLIRTKPLTGAQFFEFWRKDSVGSFNKKEANLHSIRRTVTLQVTENNEQICIACQATTQRLNLPELDVSTSTRAYAMFSASSDSLQSMKLNPEQKAGIAWIDLGKDTQLAARVLQRIETQISPLGGKD